MSDSKNEILVSIWCLTFNHEAYIRDAIEGFLSQKTNFRFRICIYDDASNDKTADIIREYMRKYPDMFFTCLANVNTYKNPNRDSIIRDFQEKAFDSKYIAWCEGDDYWCDRLKLQTQVDFLENNPNCVICGHASKWMDYERNIDYEFHPYTNTRYLSPEEIILQKNGNISTASLLMKKEIYFKEKGFPLADIGDITTQLFAITKGKFYYFDRVMSVYRYHHPGSWCQTNDSSVEKKIQHAIRMSRFYEEYDNYTRRVYHTFVKRRWYGYLMEAARTNPSLNMEFNNVYIKLFEQTLEEKNKKRLYEIYCVRCLFVEKYPSDDWIESYTAIKRFNHIIIYGTGNNSKYIENILDTLKISWDGYIVSDGEVLNHMKKKVWHLNDYPFIHDKTALIISVSQIYEEEINGAIKDYEFGMVLHPFWFENY